MSQTFCGSKAYAAPEILQGRTYDPMKADVWALGVIMYIFITGKMPFDETKVGYSNLGHFQLVITNRYNMVVSFDGLLSLLAAILK